MKTLNELIKFKMELLEQDEKVSTYNSYRTLLSYIKSHYGEVQMTDVDADFCRQLSKDLKSEGKSPSTMRTYYAMLTAIFHFASYKGYTDKDYPFQKHPYELDKVRKPKPRKRNNCFLTKEQMTSIYNLWLDLSEQYYVGLFLASYLSNGANLNDVLRFKWGKNPQIIQFHRHKTKEKTDMLITVPIIPQLKVVYDEIAAPYTENGLLFPNSPIDNEKEFHKYITSINNKVTKSIREIGPALALPDNISTTWARHTFATVMNQSNVPYAYTEMAMGHTLDGVSSNYIGNFKIEDSLKFNMNLLG